MPADSSMLDLFLRFPVVAALGVAAIGVLFSRCANYYFDDENHLRRKLYMLSLVLPHVAVAFVVSCLLGTFDWWHGLALAQVYGAVFIVLWFDKRQIMDMLTVPDCSQHPTVLQKNPSP